MSSQLSEFVNPDQQALLEQALEDLECGDFHQRWEVAQTLARLGAIAVDPLILRLTDEDTDAEVRWFIVRILGQFETEAVVQALVDVLRTVKPDEPDEDTTVREMAAAALANLGSDAVVALVPLLNLAELRLLVTEALAQIRHPETIAPLMQVVQDPNPQVRAIAIEALGSFPDQAISEVLILALKDPVAAVRKEAVIALGMRSEWEETLQLTQQLQPLLWDTQSSVVQQVQIALSRFKTPAAAAALFEQLSSALVPLPIQLGAVRALGWFETAEALTVLRQFSLELLQAKPETSLSSESLALYQEILQETIQGIGRTSEPHLQEQAVDLLVDILSCHHPVLELPQIKQQIALGLGKLGKFKALEPLIHLLAETHIGVRLHCVTALKQLADSHTYDYLKTFASQENLAPTLRQGVLVALAEW
ncbi:MAG: HEAT repeat domain-containing protein [Microcoleaceae cyanobacterium]